ncbi:hypothetical protein Trydic_g18189 [Trypoxylus dichotomus]
MIRRRGSFEDRREIGRRRFEEGKGRRGLEKERGACKSKLFIAAGKLWTYVNMCYGNEYANTTLIPAGGYTYEESSR